MSNLMNNIYTPVKAGGYSMGIPNRNEQTAGYLNLRSRDPSQYKGASGNPQMGTYSSTTEANNAELLRENNSLKETIANLRMQLSNKDIEIKSLRESLEDRNGAYQRGGGYASYDAHQMQMRITQLENTLRQKDDEISELRVGAGGYSDIRRLNAIIDRSKEKASQIIDIICQNIPNWDPNSADVREIRGDLVVMLNNIEAVFRDVIRYLQTNPNGVLASTESFPVIATLKKDNMELTRQVEGVNKAMTQIAGLYKSCFGVQSFLSSDQQLDRVLSLIGTIKDGLKCNTCEEIVNRCYEYESSMHNLENELNGYRRQGDLRLNYVRTEAVDRTLQDYLIQLGDDIESWVYKMNVAMNDASIAAGITVFKEEDRTRYDQQQLLHMNLNDFMAYCDVKHTLLDIRLNDMIEIVNSLIASIHSLHASLAALREESAQQRATFLAASSAPPAPSTPPAPFVSSASSNLLPLVRYSPSESVATLQQCLEDCYLFLSKYLAEVEERPDPNHLLHSSCETLLERQRAILGIPAGMSQPLTLSGNDVLLLLQRLCQREKECIQWRAKRKEVTTPPSLPYSSTAPLPSQSARIHTHTDKEIDKIISDANRIISWRRIGL